MMKKKILLSILMTFALCSCTHSVDKGIANKYAVNGIEDNVKDIIPDSDKTQVPNTVSVYYFQIYVAEGTDTPIRIHSNVDYRFKQAYPYGTNLIQTGFPKQCDEYEPIDFFGDGGWRQFFFTNLDPLLYEEDKLTSLDQARVVYFANLK